MAAYTCSHIHSDLYLAEQLTLNSCLVSRTLLVRELCGMPASTGCSLEQVVPGCVPIIPDAWISLISPQHSFPLDSTILPKFRPSFKLDRLD